jgi:hypothetical protein
LVASVLAGCLTPFLLFSVPALGIGMSAPDIKTAKKIPQKTLGVTTSQTKFYFGYDVILNKSGGSGSGKVTFNVVLGNCTYVLGKLFTTSRIPVTCWVQATKAGDKKYLATKSPLKKIYFTYLPGHTNFTDLPFGLKSYSIALNDSRSPSISSYIDSIVLLSYKSSVRYRDYWASLYRFWSKIESNLQGNIPILKTMEASQIALGLVESAQETKEIWVFQEEILNICTAMKNLTWSNYLRDIKYFQ